MIAIFTKNSAHPDGKRPSSPPATVTLNASGDTILLQKHQHASMRNAAGWIVKALSGTVWITQDGDVRDIVLEAGQSVVMDRNGPALLSSLTTSEISVTRESCKRTAPRGTVKTAAAPAFSAARASFA